MPEPAPPIDPTRTRLCAIASVAGTLILAGCSALPADHGREAVAALLATREIPAYDAMEPHAAQAPEAFPAAPLDLDDAIRWGLTHHPGLRAEFARLGFAAADVYEAGRLTNPSLGLGHLWPTGSDGGRERSLGVTQRFTELITLPAQRRVAAAEFEQVQAQVAAAVQRHALDVADAWFELAGAVEIASLDVSLADAARLRADLATRYFEAGNLNRRALAEARANADEARLGAIGTAGRETRARSRLAALLGLPGLNELWHIRAGLPPPAAPASIGAEVGADGRLDILAARREVAYAQAALAAVRRHRYLGNAETGPRWEGDLDGPDRAGLSLAIEIPLFDRSDGRIARAESHVAQAEARLAALELDRMRTMDLSRETIAHARERFEILTGRLLPARREIVAERQLEVNFMLTGPFELLTERQREYAVSRDALAALTDYWRATVAFAAASGLPPPDISASGPQVTAASLAGEPGASAPDADDPHAHHHLHRHNGAQP